MANWALACKNCRKVFTYSQIPDTVADYYLPTRPKFPPSGAERECPIARSNPSTRQPNSRFGPTASARIVVPNDRCGHLGVLASVSVVSLKVGVHQNYCIVGCGFRPIGRLGSDHTVHLTMSFMPIANESSVVGAA